MSPLGPPPHAASRRAWLRFAFALAFAAILFWAFDAMPFQDLPAHAGLIALRHRFDSSAFEHRYFVVDPHIGPYSLFRALGELFTRIKDPIAAVRAIATMPVLLTPLALAYGRARLHGDASPTAAYFGVALSFGLMTLFGFASYLLGIAVMLIAVVLWLDLLALVDANDPRARTRELVVATFAPFVFVAHGHAFLLFLAIAFVTAIATGDRVARALRLRALIPAIALAAYVAWIERASTVPAGSTPFPQHPFKLHFQGPLDKLSLLVTPTLMTRTGIDIALGLLVWALLIAATRFTVRDLRRAPANDASRAHARALYAAALVIAIVFMVLPHTIGWFGFVDGRLVPIVLYLLILAYREDTFPHRFRAIFTRAIAPIAIALTLLAFVTMHRFQSEARGAHEVLAQIPEDATVLNLPLDPDSDVFTAHPFVHYDKLALVREDIVPSDVWFHQGTAIYPTRANPSMRLPASYSEADLHGIDWPAYRLADWDYVLVRTKPDAAAPDTPNTLSLAAHVGGFWLYRRK